MNPDPNPRLFSFVGGATGTWRVTLIKPYIGEPLPGVERLDIVNRNVPPLRPVRGGCCAG